MITYFKDINHKTTKNYKNYKTQNSLLESVETIVFIGATSISWKMSITGIGMIVLPISAGIVCALSFGNKLLHKMIISKHNNFKKQNQRDQHTIIFFDKLYRKRLQDNLIDGNE